MSLSSFALPFGQETHGSMLARPESGSTSRRIQRRRHQRVKRACDLCRELKRKCNGLLPCLPCGKHRQHCTFQSEISPTNDDYSNRHPGPLDYDLSQSRGWNGLSNQNEPLSGGREQPASPMENSDAERGLLQALSTKTGYSMAEIRQPMEIQLLEESTARNNSPVGLDTLISEAEIQELADNCFNKVLIHFKFLEQQDFRDRLRKRFDELRSRVYQDSVFDAVICGVAALGSLFPGQKAPSLESALVAQAGRLLDEALARLDLSQDLIIASVLRTIYFRQRGSAFPAWISSCTTIHLIDGLTNSRDRYVYDPTATVTNEVSENLKWTSRLFNACLSFECGKARIGSLDVYDATSSTATGADYLIELCKIYEKSHDSLESQPWNSERLDHFLLEMDSITSSGPIQLLSAALVFKIYSISYVVISEMPDHTTQKVLSTGKRALLEVVELSSRGEAWWGVKYLPYQFLCILLSMDTSDSLSLVGTTLDTIQKVAQALDYDISAQKTLETTCQLIKRFHERKTRNLSSLLTSLNGTRFQDLLHNSVGGANNADESALAPLDDFAFDDLGLDWPVILQ